MSQKLPSDNFKLVEKMKISTELNEDFMKN